MTHPFGKMQTNTARKYLAVQQRYKQLYEIDRLRYDDVIKQLMAEFFCSEGTIRRILITELPALEEAKM
jgi:hypothetical protein